MQTANIQLETLTCPSCLQKINNALKGLDGVEKESVKVMFNSSRVKVTYNNDLLNINKIEATINNLGYNVIKSTVRPV